MQLTQACAGAHRRNTLSSGTTRAAALVEAQHERPRVDLPRRLPPLVLPGVLHPPLSPSFVDADAHRVHRRILELDDPGDHGVSLSEHRLRLLLLPVVPHEPDGVDEPDNGERERGPPRDHADAVNDEVARQEIEAGRGEVDGLMRVVCASQPGGPPSPREISGLPQDFDRPVAGACRPARTRPCSRRYLVRVLFFRRTPGRAFAGHARGEASLRGPRARLRCPPIAPLRAARVDRPVLCKQTAARMRVRLDDLRATFVPIALANVSEDGYLEEWPSGRRQRF
jgi:hypothetical protein